MSLKRLLLLIALFFIFQTTYGASFDKMKVGVWTNDTSSLQLKALKKVLYNFQIPHELSSNFSDLKNFPLCLLAGPLRESKVDNSEINKIYRYVEEGGTVFLSGEVGKSWYHLLGLRELTSSKKRFSIKVKTNTNDKILSYIDHNKERILRLGNPELYKQTVWTFGAKPGVYRELASFADSSSALTVNEFALGKSYYIGVGWENSILLPLVGNDLEAQKKWINSFETSTDMFMLLIKSCYEASAKISLSVPFTPENSSTSLMLSHDIDARESFKNSLEFAKMEEELGVKSSFFVTTKTFVDNTDTSYFHEKNIAYLKTVYKMGFPIGSHSVSHSKTFEKFPIGKLLLPEESYKPLEEKNLFGEVEWSRQLLNNSGFKSNSFRAGELAYHPDLVYALEKCGYTLNSTFSANDIMCNFPFFAFHHRNLASTESRILEIPVTFDGSMGYLTEKNKKELVDRWTNIVELNGKNGAVSTILIHPNITSYKLGALKELIIRVKKKNVWVGSLEDYELFFRERFKTSVSYAKTARHTLFLRLNVPYDSIPASFNLEIGGNKTERINLRDRNLRLLSFSSQIINGKRRLFNIGLDKTYYLFQKRLVGSIAGLLGFIIFSLCLFLAVQRLKRSWAKRKFNLTDFETRALEIIVSNEPLALKTISLKKLNKPDILRSLLLHILSSLKGSAADDIRELYQLLGLFRIDLKGLKNPKWWKKAEAARTLGELKISESVSGLIKLINDRNLEVRLAVSFALGMIGDKKSVPKLIDVILKSDTWTASVMIRNMGQLNEEAVRAFIGILEKSTTDDETKIAVIEALGYLKSLEAIPSILPFLKSENEKFVITALNALGEIGDDKSLNDIFSHLPKTMTEPIHLTTLNTVEKLGSPNSLSFVLKSLSEKPSICKRALKTLFALGKTGIEALDRLIMEESENLQIGALLVLEENGIMRERCLAVQSKRGSEKDKIFLSRLESIGLTKYLNDFNRKQMRRKDNES